MQQYKSLYSQPLPVAWTISVKYLYENNCYQQWIFIYLFFSQYIQFYWSVTNFNIYTSASLDQLVKATLDMCNSRGNYLAWQVKMASQYTAG